MQWISMLVFFLFLFVLFWNLSSLIDSDLHSRFFVLKKIQFHEKTDSSNFILHEWNYELDCQS